ncbi:hypothetical protein OAB90_01130 [bacterium]|nr:hypothetical protein [bacterium]
MNFSKDYFKYHIVLLAVISYLIWGTGIYTDDYALLNYYSNKAWYIEGWSNNYLSLIPWWVIKSPVYIFGDASGFLFDIAKICIVYATIICLCLALRVFIEQWPARILSIFIILYPTHDSTVYWYNGQYFNYGILLVSLAFYLQEKRKYVLSVPVNTLGAFFSYASPPLGFGFIAVYCYQKKWLSALIFGIPHLLYFLYYLGLKVFFEAPASKLKTVTAIDYLQTLTLQLATLLDSQIGISFLLKIVYSISSNSLYVFIPVIMLLYFSSKQLKKIRVGPVYSPELFVLLISITVSALVMFALTGDFYYQVNFNLGNRVTFYASFLFAFLLLSLVWNTKYLVLYAGIIILSITGISNHYKEWNQLQVSAINNMSNHDGLQKAENNSILLIKGNLYSKLGPFSHLEFITWNSSRDIFGELYGDKFKAIIPLTSRLVVDDVAIHDKKYDISVMFDRHIYIYDIETNLLISLNANEIPPYIKATPMEIRHWIQAVSIGPLKKLILKMAPRLEYLFV